MIFNVIEEFVVLVAILVVVGLFSVTIGPYSDSD